jgi:hypothetical protein
MNAWIPSTSARSRDSGDSAPARPVCSAMAVLSKVMTTVDSRAAVAG